MPPRRDEHNQPAPSGQVTRRYGRPDAVENAEPLSRDACRITAELTEDGNLKVEISGRVAYAQDAFVGHSISSAADEIPKDVLDELRAALNDVLDEAHDYLKARLEDQVKFAVGHARTAKAAEEDK